MTSKCTTGCAIRPPWLGGRAAPPRLSCRQLAHAGERIMPVSRSVTGTNLHAQREGAGRTVRRYASGAAPPPVASRSRRRRFAAVPSPACSATRWHGQIGGLQQSPRQQHPLHGEPAAGGRAGGDGEGAVEAAFAHPGVCGHLQDADRVGNVFGSPGDVSRRPRNGTVVRPGAARCTAAARPPGQGA